MAFREYVENYTCQMEAMRIKLTDKKKGEKYNKMLSSTTV